MLKLIKTIMYNSSLSKTQLAIFILAVLFSTFFGYYYASAYWTISPIWGLFLGFIIAILASFLGIFFQNYFGNLSFKFHMGNSSTRSIREQLEGDLSIATNYKMQKKYNEALNILNNILRQDPEFPEALLLKAQILWQGLDSADNAKACLEKIMKVEKDQNDTIYRWASNLNNEISVMRNRLFDKKI